MPVWQYLDLVHVDGACIACLAASEVAPRKPTSGLIEEISRPLQVDFTRDEFGFMDD